MRIIIFLVSCVLIISCKTPKTSIVQQVQGHFHKSGKDFEINLVINSDKTFSLEESYGKASVGCDGKIIMDKESLMLIKCDSIKEKEELIATGYMKQREHKIKIISRNKIKYKDIILRKK